MSEELEAVMGVLDPVETDTKDDSLSYYLELGTLVDLKINCKIWEGQYVKLGSLADLLENKHDHAMSVEVRRSDQESKSMNCHPSVYS